MDYEEQVQQHLSEMMTSDTIQNMYVDEQGLDSSLSLSITCYCKISCMPLHGQRYNMTIKKCHIRVAAHIENVNKLCRSFAMICS